MTKTLLLHEYKQPEWDLMVLGQVGQAIDQLRDIPAVDLANLDLEECSSYLVLKGAYQVIREKMIQVERELRVQKFRQSILTNGRKK